VEWFVGYFFFFLLLLLLIFRILSAELILGSFIRQLLPALVNISLLSLVLRLLS
jgi:hypothetical protein